MNEYLEIILKLKHKVFYDEMLSNDEKDEVCAAIKQVLDALWPVIY